MRERESERLRRSDGEREVDREEREHERARERKLENWVIVRRLLRKRVNERK